ncbi:hypothetical protein HALDL1_13425 [Halobacterium sp. DL1]|jgi:hypothetical protein|nr:hypothetical protein HALDL1_13425 [Halobacterium sp. DL1]
MDESLRTAATYEAHADVYCEKYRAGSVADGHGDPFFDALTGDRVLADDGVLFCSVKRGESAGFEPDDDHGGGDDRFFAYYGGEEFSGLLGDAGLAGEVRADGRWVSALATPR